MQRQAPSEFVSAVETHVSKVVRGLKVVLATSQLTNADKAAREGLELKVHAASMVDAIEALLKVCVELKLALLSSNVLLADAEAQAVEQRFSKAADEERARLKRVRVRCFRRMAGRWGRGGRPTPKTTNEMTV